MITEYRRKRILKRCINIMYNNPELFVVSSAFRDYAEKIVISDYEFEFYVKYILENRCGLDFIINQLCEGFKNLLTLIPNQDTNFDAIEKMVAIETLTKYISLDRSLKADINNKSKIIHRLYNEECKK